ncbi:YqeB family protein [Allorhizocola rhizosphaerae]|uniref:YqeB family protein n=1 Tax=Allorhizocola rhizosphaerae TaxID=1872709 RepID=UPI000E3C62C8|nr:hypothetical protein [Allorhizocola rhizosphaerae]
MTPTGPTVVRDPVWVRVLVWLGFPIAGALLGYLLKLVSRWIVGLEWAPWQGPFKLLTKMHEPWFTIVPVAVGVVAGLVLALLAWEDSLRVSVSRESVGLRRGDKERELSAAAVRGVFVDGKELVLLGASGEELAREKSDLDGGLLREAFGAHGFAWLDGDPFAGRYRRWVEGDPALSGSANAVLKARASALDKGHKEDAAELREELVKLGVVVRDVGKKQWWRVIEPV